MKRGKNERGQCGVGRSGCSCCETLCRAFPAASHFIEHGAAIHNRFGTLCAAHRSCRHTPWHTGAVLHPILGAVADSLFCPLPSFLHAVGAHHPSKMQNASYLPAPAPFSPPPPMPLANSGCFQACFQAHAPWYKLQHPFRSRRGGTTADSVECCRMEKVADRGLLLRL